MRVFHTPSSVQQSKYTIYTILNIIYSKKLCIYTFKFYCTCLQNIKIFNYTHNKRNSKKKKKIGVTKFKNKI